MFALSAYLNMVFDDGSFPERVDRVADAGLDGVELYGWDRDLEPVVERCAARDLDLVYMSGGRPPLTDPARADEAVENIRESIALAERVGCRNLNVKAGAARDDLDRATQRTAVVETLERVAPDAEAAGVTLVLEPLNTTVDHPGHFAATAADGADLVAAVDSPAVRLLFDFYHEQIMAGDVIRSFREHADLVGHVHIADNPGRHQPGTGELDYGNVLAAVAETGYDGYVGCEFAPTADADPVAVLREVRALV